MIRRPDTSRIQLSNAHEIRRGLGGDGSSLDPFPLKPKYTHWCCYECVKLEARTSFHESMMGFATRLNIAQGH